MAVTFSDLNSLPDILSSGRHELYFPSISVVNAKNLMLTNTQVTLPTMGVGHVRAKLLGHSIGFRGGLSFDNTLTCSFYELSDGQNIKSLFSWYKMVRNIANGTSMLKNQYSADGTLRYINTIGESAFEARLINVFPINITFPESSSENTGPTEFQVTFNVDQVDIEGTAGGVSVLYDAIRG